MSKGAALAVLGLAAAACGSARGVEPVPLRAADFRRAQIRQPAFLVRLTFAGQRSDREREALPVEYEGALLEGLNARAVLARDVQVVAGRNAKLDARAALERARALGADHAIVVDVRVSADEPIFCRGSRRPFCAPATVWSQSVQVLRTSDGATRLTIADDAGLAITDWDVDCRSEEHTSELQSHHDVVCRLLPH